jgi:CysZ protein
LDSLCVRFGELVKDGAERRRLRRSLILDKFTNTNNQHPSDQGRQPIRGQIPLYSPPRIATSAIQQRQKMFDDAIKAVTQIFAAPLRAVLWKSVALALALIVVVGIVLDRLIIWLLGAGSASVETTLGPQAHWPASALAWLLSVAASLGIIVGSVFLMPAVTAFVASFFADQIADEVEREHYPADPPGKALPLWRAIVQGSRTALLAVLVYLIAVPFLLFAGFGAVIFFVATAWLLSREYFELAAMRFRPPEEAKALRKRNAAKIFIAGLFIAAFVSIPVVNLATPLFAMALMVHLYKRIGGPRLIAQQG